MGGKLTGARVITPGFKVNYDLTPQRVPCAQASFPRDDRYTVILFICLILGVWFAASLPLSVAVGKYLAARS